MSYINNDMKRVISIILILSIILFSLSGCNSKQVNNNNVDIESKANEYIESFNKVCTNSKYIGNIIIGKGDEIVYKKSYGNEYLEDSSTLNEDSIFRIGSISKTFTSVAILQLHEKGLLDINNPISNYIPLENEDINFTIKSILNHTSGLIRDGYINFNKEYSDENKLSLKLASEPLTEWIYSNYGYQLLAYLIENVTNTSYENYIQENILIPLDMKNTGCERVETIIPNLAQPYKVHSGQVKSGISVNMCNYVGDGDIYSTTSDLFKFVTALESEKLLKRDTLELMTKDDTGLSVYYGLGLELGEIKGHKWFGHGGAIVHGYRSTFLYFPEDDVTVIILLNVFIENITDLALPLAAIVMDEEYYLPVDGNEIMMNEEDLEIYEGEYKTIDDIIVSIKNIGNNQLEVTPSGMKTILIPYSSTDFAIKGIEYYKIQFVFDDNNKVKSLVGYTNIDKIVEAEKIN